MKNNIMQKKPDFEEIQCWNCNKTVKYYYTTFFVDKNGVNRYGALCKKCYKERKK